MEMGTCGGDSRRYTEAERQSKIELAFRSLPFPILPDRADLVGVYAIAIAQMVDRVDLGGRAPANFRRANKETIEKQLRDLRDRARRLADKLEHGGVTTRARAQLALLIRELSDDTIEALGDAIEALGVVESRPSIADLRNCFPDALERGDDLSPIYLRAVADAARRALLLEREGKSVGAPKDLRALALTKVAAKAYSRLTGHFPPKAANGLKQRQKHITGTSNSSPRYLTRMAFRRRLVRTPLMRPSGSEATKSRGDISTPTSIVASLFDRGSRRFRVCF